MKTGLGLVWKSLLTAWERGVSLVLMFFFLGVAAVLVWIGAGAYDVGMQIAAGIVGVLVWAGAMMIALNILIDSDTKIVLSSMYVTDYKGIVWTTTSFLAGAMFLAALLTASSALLWIPRYMGVTDQLIALLMAPRTLSLTQAYVLIVQAQALLLTGYLAARFMLFPVYVAVESNTFRGALKNSWVATRNHVPQLVVSLVVTVASPVTAVHAGIVASPHVVTYLQAVPLPVSAGRVAVTGTVVLFLALGCVVALSVLATAYSAFRTEAEKV